MSEDVYDAEDVDVGGELGCTPTLSALMISAAYVIMLDHCHCIKDT